MKPFLPNDQLNTSKAEAMQHAIVAAFPSREAAEKAADDLRNMGVANEGIAFMPGEATVDSVANSPITYRATDMAASGHMQQDAASGIVGDIHEERSPATTRNPEQDASMQARQPDYLHPNLEVVVSVIPGPGNADAIRQTLEAAGGILQSRPADRRITDHGAEDPESNSRVA